MDVDIQQARENKAKLWRLLFSGVVLLTLHTCVVADCHSSLL